METELSLENFLDMFSKVASWCGESKVSEDIKSEGATCNIEKTCPDYMTKLSLVWEMEKQIGKKYDREIELPDAEQQPKTAYDYYVLACTALDVKPDPEPDSA